MATPGKDIAPFLANNPAASSGAKAGAGSPPYESRPQKDGTSNAPDGSNDKFPNRPQPDAKPAYNPASVPNGGPMPYKGPSMPTQKPFKLGS